ncbi:cysteine--tRNA ligase [Candidatus Nitromaritima sp. SCGC AAA799-C22]|nr:cysteine--tRNA ligase [Candidatus Nitromaritima sp. SCGC AAA799-C22]
MDFKIFNTLSGKKETFAPLAGNRVGMYVCGVTVYDYCHVGHARAAVVFDTIFRYLKHRGYEVNYVRNFTDIDDKIINRALEEKIPWQEVTKKYIDAFYEDMGRLNIELPTVEPKATDHIPEMLDMIASLVDQGKAYESDGDVFYSVGSFDGYGKLSGKNTDDLQAGARVDVNESKRDALDFALWKKSKPDEPAWDSPWGAGRPGWHIECSAMGRKYLGDTFDIHGGGKDLVFPHHENEIAQSCGVTGCPPVRFWVHNGFVNIDKEKMSKSLGNFFTLRDIYKKHHPETLRLFLISSHYRSPVDFSEKNLEDAEKVLSRFYEALADAEKVLSGALASTVAVRQHPLIAKCEAAMDDDFNTAVVMAHLNEALRAINTERSQVAQGSGDKEKLAFDVAAFRFACGLLGLLSGTPEKFQREIFELKKSVHGIDVEKIESLIEERSQARKDKEWDRADRCRDELTGMGVILEDTAHGTEWKIK